jgi:hypothetical protein
MLQAEPGEFLVVRAKDVIAVHIYKLSVPWHGRIDEIQARNSAAAYAQAMHPLPRSDWSFAYYLRQ